MARLPRVYVEGAVYYVTCRGAHSEELFKRKKDYKMYLELLERYKQEYGFKLFAYVLLPHHLHLLIEPKKEVSISEIMRSLNTAYSKYFNSQYQRKGHLFRERFRASIVEKELYLLKLVNYIHLNPLRLGLVSNVEEYPYSSYFMYRDRTREEVREILTGIEDYSDYIKRTGEKLELHKSLQRGGILGSKDFVKKVKEKIKHKGEKEIKKFNTKYILTGVGVVSVLILISLVSVINFLRSKNTQNRKAEKEIYFPMLIIREIKDLDNTEWEVKFTSLKGSSSFTDTLSFVKGKFVSAWFYQEGFKPTNYSIMQEREKIIWETIQTKGNSTLSWRGEIEGNKMQGIVSLRQEGKAPQDFSFISVSLRRKE